MLTPAHCELARSQTEYYFGDNVAAIIRILFSYDQVSFKLLRMNLAQIPQIELRKSLLNLVKYQLVDYTKSVRNSNHQFEYSVSPYRLFSFYRLPRYFSSITCGYQQVILKTIVSRGLLGKAKLIEHVISSLGSLTTDSLRSQITDDIEILVSEKCIAKTGDNLCINIERMTRRQRDSLIIETIFKYYDKEHRIRAIGEGILTLTSDNTADDAQITAPCSMLHLFEYLKSRKIFESDTFIEKYLAKLTTESNNRFFVSCGYQKDKGLMYAINIGLVLNYLVKEHLSSMITTRFGPKCCRIFRLLLLRGPMLSKQIEDVIMLPARDVREYCYMLIKAGFVRNRQVPKTPDNAPGKSVFIMSIELDQVIYTTADLCCKTISNLHSRHQHEIQRNKSLLDKSKAVESLQSTSGTADNDDWTQYFSSHELSQIEIVNRKLDKILRAKAQVDETLFLLHSYMQLNPL